MKTVDMTQMGNLLNMSNVFSLYMNQILEHPDKQAQTRLSQLRTVIHSEINHVTQKELSLIMIQLTKRTKNYSVVTRVSLEKALHRANPVSILIASALLEDEGQQQALLYLLHHTKHPYKGKDLLTRFGFTQSSQNKPN